MAKPRLIPLDEVQKKDVVICPECGAIFVKTVKGEQWSFWRGTGVFCPVCGSLVVREIKKDDSTEPKMDKKKKDEESWF